MSNATETAHGRIVQHSTSESYHCPHCSGAIAPECALGEMVIDKETGRTLRVMRLLCEHCDKLFKALFRIQGENLVLVELPIQVTDPRERGAFMKRVDALRGNRQLVA